MENKEFCDNKNFYDELQRAKDFEYEILKAFITYGNEYDNKKEENFFLKYLIIKKVRELNNEKYLDVILSLVQYYNKKENK